MLYVCMTVRTAMLGMPASGKTTAAFNLNKKLNQSGLYSIVIPEAARTVIQANNKDQPNAKDQLDIARYQSEMEKIVKKHNPDVFISEQIPSVSEAYTRTYYPNRKDIAQEILEFEENHSYDIVFHTEPLEYKSDGTRYQKDKDLDPLNAHLNRHARKYDTVWLPDGEDKRVEKMYCSVLKELSV